MGGERHNGTIQTICKQTTNGPFRAQSAGLQSGRFYEALVVVPCRYSKPVHFPIVSRQAPIYLSTSLSLCTSRCCVATHNIVPMLLALAKTFSCCCQVLFWLVRFFFCFNILLLASKLSVTFRKPLISESAYVENRVAREQTVYQMKTVIF